MDNEVRRYLSKIPEVVNTLLDSLPIHQRDFDERFARQVMPILPMGDEDFVISGWLEILQLMRDAGMVRVAGRSPNIVYRRPQ